jgi:membrane protein YdbS with pleckstrin-like domain
LKIEHPAQVEFHRGKMAKSYIDNLLGDNEKILLVTHQHWFVLLRSIVIELAFIILLLIGITIPVLISGISWAAFLYLLLLIPSVLIAWRVINWNSQKFIITNHRVINVNGVINKNVIDSSLEKVNDVKLTQSYLGRIFDYGDIEIMTASELGVNLLKRITRPIKYKKTMLNAKEASDHLVVFDKSHSPQNIPELIIKLGELKEQGLISEAEFSQKKTELLAKLG